MGFTEVTFELSDAQHPLCTSTRAPLGHHAVVRLLHSADPGRAPRAHVAFHGPPEAAATLVDGLRTVSPGAAISVLDQHPANTGLILEGPGSDPGAGYGFVVIPETLGRHGMHALVDPLVAIDGRLRVRLMIPREADPQEILKALQEVQRAAGFSDFRITRIAPLSPAAHVEMSRRALAPEQEALLALAVSMGYYETPKVVTLEHIARTVGLSISPVHKKLKAAEEAIVAQHMAAPALDAARRRGRRTGAPLDTTSPWEIQVRARGDFGPANILARHPETRASLHALAPDAVRTRSSLLVLVAQGDTRLKIMSAIEDRPEVASLALIEQSPDHAAYRLTTRERGLFSLSWWHEAWGDEGAVRAVVFEGGEARVRAFVTRAARPADIEARVDACARLAGWTDWEIEALRSLSEGHLPPIWPDPLTLRQDEVLRVAHAKGYYRTPRGCTLDEVAKTLGVSANAVHKNLVLAEAKLISTYLASGL